MPADKPKQKGILDHDPTEPPIEQIRADVERAEAMIEQVRQTLGLSAAIAFGDVPAERAGQPSAERALDDLAKSATEDLSSAVNGMPWLVKLSDEERARLQEMAPTDEERDAMREAVEALSEIPEEELAKIADEHGNTMTRADIEKLRDSFERVDLMERLQEKVQELSKLLASLQQGELEMADRAMARAAAKKKLS